MAVCLAWHGDRSLPGFRFPAEIIQHAVWLYHCLSLSLRDVELILAERGIVVSYESRRGLSRCIAGTHAVALI
jgi:transposase-like protein